MRTAAALASRRAPLIFRQREAGEPPHKNIEANDVELDAP
jgi:hypothetical protein